MPHLQALALNVYSQPISQSTVKQLFSIYDGIMGPKRNKLSFATQIPNATCVPVSDFGAGTRIFAYLRVPTKIVVVRVPKPFFMPHHTTKVKMGFNFQMLFVVSEGGKYAFKLI